MDSSASQSQEAAPRRYSAAYIKEFCGSNPLCSPAAAFYCEEDYDALKAELDEARRDIASLTEYSSFGMDGYRKRAEKAEAALSASVARERELEGLIRQAFNSGDVFTLEREFKKLSALTESLHADASRHTKEEGSREL